MTKKISTDTFISTVGGKASRVSTPLVFGQNFYLDLVPPKFPQNTLVTPWGGREMIKDFFSTVWNDPQHENDILAVEFDKQSLMLILSQSGCEGIRFSFCQFGGKTSLVAFGIEQSGKLIGELMFKEGFDPTTIPLGPPPGSEEGHGITIKDFKNTLSEKELGDRNFEKITDYFFEYTFPSNNNL